jgi:hypothetical protein
MRAEELERRGLSAADARREARERFGDVEGTRHALSRYGERTERQTRLRGLVDDFWLDTRYAWRSLRRSPAFSAVAVVVLALGIGVNSAMFNLADLLLVRSVQVAEPERVVAIYAHNLERPSLWRGFSYPEYREIRAQSRALADIAAFTMDLVGIGEQDDTRRAFVAYVSAEYFHTLGVPPARGRAFSATEERDRDAAVVVLSHGAWLRNGGDPNVVGTMVRVNGEFHEVIGVAGSATRCKTEPLDRSRIRRTAHGCCSGAWAKTPRPPSSRPISRASRPASRPSTRRSKASRTSM